MKKVQEREAAECRDGGAGREMVRERVKRQIQKRNGERLMKAVRDDPKTDLKQISAWSPTSFSPPLPSDLMENFQMRYFIQIYQLSYLLKPL